MKKGILAILAIGLLVSFFAFADESCKSELENEEVYAMTITHSHDCNSTNCGSQQQEQERKVCPYCNGTGERIQHESGITFGLDGPRVYCSKCNQSWSYGTIHVHHICNRCNGTGYVVY